MRTRNLSIDIDRITTMPDMVAITEPSKQSIKLPDPHPQRQVSVSINVEKPTMLFTGMIIGFVMCLALIFVLYEIIR